MVGMKLVKEGQADAFVSAGSSGAVLVGGQVIVGRIKGVERPPLAPLIPTEKGVSLLVDCGANVDARPSHLVQFAKMGSIYMEHVVGIKNPKVGIVNIGAEEEKGNALVKETFPLIKRMRRISILLEVWRQERFRMDRLMSLSVKHLPVMLFLNYYEGVGSVLISEIKKGMMGSLRSKIGALLVKPALKKALKSFDCSPSTAERHFWDSTVSLSRHTAALLRRKSAIRLYSVLHLKNRRLMRRSKKVFSRSNFR